jgi:hypothetical protein
VRFTPRVSAPAGPPPDPNCAACSAAAVPAGMTIPNPNPDSNGSGAEFGYSVSVDGCYAVFGAPYAAVPELSDKAVGEVFVFSATSGSWVYEQRLIPEAGDNLGDCDYFGASVAVSACTHTIVVGTQGPGTATIFRKPSDKWTRTQFIDINSTNSGGFADDSNVVFDGTALAIGAGKANSQCGAVYTYALNAASDVWDLQQVFDPVSIGSTCNNTSYATARGFGVSVAMANNTMVVGAPGAPGTTIAGAAYVLTKNLSGLWSLSQELYPTTSTASDNYGRRVAISRTGDTIMVGGGNYETVNPFIGAWAWNSTAWAAQTFTGGNDFFPGFGNDGAIVVDGDVAFASNPSYTGAPLPNAYRGLVGVFKRTAGGVWDNTTLWTPADVGEAGGSNDIQKFGYAMRLSKANAAGFSTLVVGAGGSTINGASSGVGYLKSVNLASL